MPRRILFLLVAVCLAAPASASGAVTFKEFPLAADGGNEQATDVALGPDGNMWFTKVSINGGKLVRVVPSATPVITEFVGKDPLKRPGAIAAGPDGLLWYTENSNTVVKFVPGQPVADGTRYTLAGVDGFSGIARGLDGNMWLASSGDDRVLVVNTSGAIVKTIDFDPNCGPRGATAGPDGRMWVVCYSDSSLRAVTPSGAYNSVRVPIQGEGLDIAASPDGYLWYVNDTGISGRVRANGTGAQSFPGTGNAVYGVVAGPDGNMWLSRGDGANAVIRATPAGLLTPFPIANSATPQDIERGPNNTLWYGTAGNAVGRVSGIPVPVAPGGGGGVVADKLAPRMSGVGMSDRTVVVGKGRTPRVAAATGTTIRYTLTEAATVRLRFERKLAGRRKAKKCVKPRRKLRKRRKCTRYRSAGTLVRTSRAGRNSVKFTGRIGRKALKRGRYRLVIRATDGSKNASKRRTIAFRVVKPAKRKRR